MKNILVIVIVLTVGFLAGRYQSQSEQQVSNLSGSHKIKKPQESPKIVSTPEIQRNPSGTKTLKGKIYKPGRKVEIDRKMVAKRYKRLQKMGATEISEDGPSDSL